MTSLTESGSGAFWNEALVDFELAVERETVSVRNILITIEVAKTRILSELNLMTSQAYSVTMYTLLGSWFHRNCSWASYPSVDVPNTFGCHWIRIKILRIIFLSLKISSFHFKFGQNREMNILTINHAMLQFNSIIHPNYMGKVNCATTRTEKVPTPIIILPLFFVRKEIVSCF